MANQTMQLSRLLNAAGLQVEVVQVNAPYAPRWIGRLPLIRALARLIPYAVRLWGCVGRCDVLHIMANSGWSWHLFAAPAIWVARTRAVPVLVNYRGGQADEFLETTAKAVRFSMRQTAGLIVPSAFLQQVFARHGMAAEIIPNIIDLERFHPAPAPPVTPHVVVARQLEPLYDIGSALRAMALVLQRHPQARMTVAGSGPERGRLGDLVQTLGIGERVRFAGQLTNDAMAALYRSASISLNTALADNMPNSVLEALASGVPVVSTNVGGIPYLLRHEHTALLVPPGDAQAMAQAVSRLIEDAGLRQSLVHNGREYVQTFAWARVRERWLETYRRALQASALHTRPGV